MNVLSLNNTYFDKPISPLTPSPQYKLTAKSCVFVNSQKRIKSDKIFTDDQTVQQRFYPGLICILCCGKLNYKI